VIELPDDDLRCRERHGREPVDVGHAEREAIDTPGAPGPHFHQRISLELKQPRVLLKHDVLLSGSGEIR
jgi:hypothetical protein